MVKEELDRLALRAQEGCKISEWSIISNFHSFICSEADKARNSIKNQESLERDCIGSLMRTVKHFKPRGKSFYWLAKINIMSEIHKHKCRYVEHSLGVTVVPLYREDDEGNEVPVDVVDVLANVEKIVELRSEMEKVALLAEGDSVKETILANWLGGYTDTDSAAILANRFGKKSESMRKTIQRFRSHCQKALA